MTFYKKHYDKILCFTRTWGTLPQGFLCMGKRPLILPKLTYSGFSLRALQGIISSLKEVILGGDKDSAK